MRKLNFQKVEKPGLKNNPTRINNPQIKVNKDNPSKKFQNDFLKKNSKPNIGKKKDISKENTNNPKTINLIKNINRHKSVDVYEKYINNPKKKDKTNIDNNTSKSNTKILKKKKKIN